MTSAGPYIYAEPRREAVGREEKGRVMNRSVLVVDAEANIVLSLEFLLKRAVTACASRGTTRRREPSPNAPDLIISTS